MKCLVPRYFFKRLRFLVARVNAELLDGLIDVRDIGRGAIGVDDRPELGRVDAD